MLESRLGIHLTPLKILIFDLVKRSSDGGVHIDDLYASVGKHHLMSRKTLKAHFFQINKKIASTGYRISSRGRFVRLVSVWKK